MGGVADVGIVQLLAGQSCEEAQAAEATAADTYWSANLNRSFVHIAPADPDVEAREASEVIGHAVAVGQIRARPKSDRAPF